MHPFLRNALALVAGIVAGSIVNMGLIHAGSALFPPPAGVDVNSVESINAHIKDYSVVQLLMPFIAHALGTLAGAFVAARLCANRPWAWALIVAIFFLSGGIMAVRMIPAAPLWFDALDLVVAYLPMAWLGMRFAKRGTGA